MQFEIAKTIARGIHEQIDLEHLDDDQDDNYYKAFINMLKNERIREYLFDNLAEAVIKLDLSSNEERKSEIVEVVIYIFDGLKSH